MKINNTIKENIDTIVRDALHTMNYRGITNYTEGEIHENVQYHIEQYRESSDDLTETLLNQVDVILCTEEIYFEEENKEEALKKLNDNWANIEGLLKKDILIREYFHGISYEITQECINSILTKNVKYGGLTEKEERIHQIKIFDEMYNYTPKQLHWKKKRILSRNIPSEKRDEIEELFKKRNFTLKEIVMFCKNYKQ